MASSTTLVYVDRDESCRCSRDRPRTVEDSHPPTRVAGGRGRKPSDAGAADSRIRRQSRDTVPTAASDGAERLAALANRRWLQSAKEVRVNRRRERDPSNRSPL